MAEIVRLAQRKDQSGNWGLNLVLKKRKALMRTVPIMSDQITQLDKWLVTQPITIKELIQIWSRSMYVEWVMYGDLSPDLKHLILLRLRDHYREFQTLPASWQARLWPMWANWMAEFLDEEMEQEAANG
jgi:hypothetical protein